MMAPVPVEQQDIEVAAAADDQDKSEARKKSADKSKDTKIKSDEEGNNEDKTNDFETTDTEEEESVRVSRVAAALDLFRASIHENLARDVPRWTGCCLACCVLAGMLAFVFGMYVYSYSFTCEQKVAVISGDWPLVPAQTSFDQVWNGTSSVTKFDPYNEMFEAPTILCATYAFNDFSSYYDLSCMLSGLTCEDYVDDNDRCPGDFREVFACEKEYEYPRVRTFENGTEYVEYVRSPWIEEECGKYNANVNVAYTECPSAWTAFSSGVAYMVYLQAGLALLCLFLYKCFLHYCTKEETTLEMQELVSITKGTLDSIRRK